MGKLTAALSMVAIVAGCASPVYVPYPYPEEGERTGRVVISFTQPMESVSVQIDGSLVAEDEYTERVEIQDVPVGKRMVEIAASEGSRTQAVHRTEVVTVEADRESTILIDTPPHSSGYWVYRAAVWLGLFLPAFLID